MHCPFCGHVETKVNDSRLAGEGRQIRRRRECLKCGERFTTFETAELVMPVVVKGDRARQTFDEAKLRAAQAPVAWRQLLTTPALWPFYVGYFALPYCQYLFLTWLPNYLVQSLQLLADQTAGGLAGISHALQHSPRARRQRNKSRRSVTLLFSISELYRARL